MSPRFLEKFPDYSSLLLSGPPGVGKFDYMMEALKAYLEAGQRVLFVSIDVSPTEVHSYVERNGGDLSSYVGQSLLFIDSFTPSISDEVGAEPEGTILVSSFSNLEGLGMGIAKGAERLSVPLKVLFYTISTLFLHNSPQSLSKFFQIVSARVKTQMGLILYATHEGVNEEKQENLLRSLVDGVLEMRFDGSMKREIRLHHLRGRRVDPRWFPFDERAEESTEVAPAKGVWSLGQGRREG
ncbi:MAG: RAD55 family ATPase [Thermoplasmata archaeon]